MQEPLISLIVAVYKNTEALRLIFSSLEQQSVKNFEVIVAEDNNSPEMAALIAIQQQKGVFSLKHVSQEDIGFRKNKILNAAIRKSSGTYCTFIDGDCIPHKHFLKNISKHAQENVVLAGRRVMLSEKMSEKLYREQGFRGSISCLRLILEGCKHVEKGLYLPFMPAFSRKTKLVIGCNMTISKNNLIAINGFDEIYTRPSVGEDVDIAWRLRMFGCDIKFMKYQGIVYHLYHSQNYNKEDSAYNIKLFYEKQNDNNWKNHKDGLA
ncbi:MAG: glycosyltransferase [Bacteroidales bacterium]|jgi:cellulose synthase/poly-beta-1,6-N-acetylglucosamine synthase-like glycosyltransferase|nr:glycosyltransferase [Bacteroidales bacterium]